MVRLSKKKAHAKRLNLTGRKPGKLSGNQIGQLNDKGYVLLRYTPNGANYVKHASMNDIVNLILEKGVPIINNESEVEGGDQTRLMKICALNNVAGKAARLISGRLVRTFPYLKRGIAAFLLSLAHGHEQQPHTDVEAGNEKLEDANTAALWRYVQQDKIPLSVILTYSQAATLTIWPGSHKIVWKPNSEVKGSQRGQRIRVPPYHALVFRQDLVHAGSAYLVDALRLHFYMELNVPDFTRAPNTTQPMDETFFVMPQN